MLLYWLVDSVNTGPSLVVVKPRRFDSRKAPPNNSGTSLGHFKLSSPSSFLASSSAGLVSIFFIINASSMIIDGVFA